MIEYLSWWVIALCLSAITIGYYLVNRRPLGVSGSWARIVMWQEEAAVLAAEKPLRDQPKMLIDALMQATIDEFGRETVERAMESLRGRKVEFVSEREIAEAGAMEARIPWTAHLMFLAALVAGGAIATIISQGGFSWNASLGELHRNIFGSGFSSAMALIVGGMMVGFGTQMAGGCTSGHGLSGVSRLVPASLIATCAFFGTAVVVSLLMR